MWWNEILLSVAWAVAILLVVVGGMLIGAGLGFLILAWL